MPSRPGRTSFSHVSGAIAVAGAALDPLMLTVAAVASAALYCAGMAANDIFDLAIAMEGQEEIAFRKTKNESEEVPRFKVAMGVIPDYLFSGEGMRIDGVSEDKPAQKAGLQKGDVVIQLGDSTVVDMMSYMRALSVFEEGDSTTVVVDRNGDKVSAQITF